MNSVNQIEAANFLILERLSASALNMSNTNASLNNDYDHNGKMDDTLQRIRTAGAISMSAELFEKLYLSPQNAVKGDLRKTFGNPTPM